MKKKITGIAMIALMALVASWSFNKTNGDPMIAELSLNNIDALASGEINPDCPNGCLEAVGSCYCYGDHAYEEKNWD